ncbi:MAG: helix-turn-helix transcriptional regulator [Fulvivirga sp.]
MCYNRIKEVLRDKNVSITSLANDLGKSREYVSRWVNNRSQPRLEQLSQIAEVLKVSPKDLVADKKM